MYNTQYQYTHDIDWFFFLGNTPVHCASNGGRVPNIYRAIDLQQLQVAIEAITPNSHFKLNWEVINRNVSKHYRDVNEDFLNSKGLSELVKDINYDENTPIWVKAYTWSFVKMAQRGFYSFDRDAESGRYFLVASPERHNEMIRDLGELIYTLPEEVFTSGNIQNNNSLSDRINFVSLIEKYERKRLFRSE